MMGIVGIAGNWLYYNRYRNPEYDYDVGSAICRVPVGKDKDGFDVIEPCVSGWQERPPF